MLQFFLYVGHIRLEGSLFARFLNLGMLRVEGVSYRSNLPLQPLNISQSSVLCYRWDSKFSLKL